MCICMFTCMCMYTCMCIYRDTPSDVMCVRFSPTGSLLAAGFADSSIKVRTT